MTPWICPDIEMFSLLNDPDTYEKGKSFKLIIDYCDAKNADCITDSTKREEFFKMVTVQSKVVSQYFSPSHFKETQELSYTSSEQMNTGLVGDVCVIKLFEVN